MPEVQDASVLHVCDMAPRCHESMEDRNLAVKLLLRKVLGVDTVAVRTVTDAKWATMKKHKSSVVSDTPIGLVTPL